MHKFLISEPRIGSYSAFMLLGFVAGYLITRWRATRSGIQGRHIDNATLLIAVISLFGARFVSWVFYFPAGASLWKALVSGGGGMVFYGGMIFGIGTTVLYAKLARLSLGNFMDVFAPGLAIGLAFGRIGCFMAGCCWGDLCVAREETAKLTTMQQWQVRTVPWLSPAGFSLAVRYPEGTGAVEQHRKLGLLSEGEQRSRPVHPVQLYEAALAFALCGALHTRFARRRWNGQVFCWLVLGYAAIRFSTEFLRGDNLPAYAGLTLSQVISLGLAASAGLMAFWMKMRAAQMAEPAVSVASPVFPAYEREQANR